jgi:fatty acid synthase
MGPQIRMLVEHAYEAIIDAGVNPKLLRETRTGVFVGSAYSEPEQALLYTKHMKDGFGLVG